MNEALAVFAVSASLEDRVVEHLDHLHEHVVDPAVVRDGHDVPAVAPGYSVTMWPGSLERHAFPDGAARAASGVKAASR